MSNRTKYVFYSLLPTLLMLVLQFAAVIFLSEILFVMVTADFSGSTFGEYMDAILDAFAGTEFTINASLLYSLLALVVFGVWYHALRQQGVKDFKSYMASSMAHSEHYDNVIEFRNEAAEQIREAGEEARGAFTGCKIGLIPGVIIFIVGAQLVCNFLVEFLGRAFPEWLSFYEELLRASGLEDSQLTLPLIIYAVLIGPVTEELAFRGLTYGYARRAMPLWAANAVQAVLFAGMHMNPLQSAYTLLFGLMIGYIYARSRNIVLTSLIHIGFNAFNFIVGENLFLGDTAVTFFIILLVSLMATYFGFILILRSLPVAVKVDPEDEY